MSSTRSSKRQKTTSDKDTGAPAQPVVLPSAPPLPNTSSTPSPPPYLSRASYTGRDRMVRASSLPPTFPTDSGPAKQKLLQNMLEEKKTTDLMKKEMASAQKEFDMIKGNKFIIQDVLKLATSIFSTKSIIENPENMKKLMVNGRELCFNLVKVAGNLLTMCGVIGESITNLVNMVGNFMKSGANNGILLGMLLTVLIQKRQVLFELQGATEVVVADNITMLHEKLNRLNDMLRNSGNTVIGFLVDYLSFGPAIDRIGDIMTQGYTKKLEKVERIDSELRESRKQKLIKMFDSANAEKAIRDMLKEKKNPAQVREEGETQSQPLLEGGRRGRGRRTKRRVKKSKRKHSKKRTKRRRKHSRSTKKRHRVSKMKKRKTKRKRKMRGGGGKWGTGLCPSDFMNDGSKGTEVPATETQGGQEGGRRRRKMRGGGVKWGTGLCPGDFMNDGLKGTETPVADTQGGQE